MMKKIGIITVLLCLVSSMAMANTAAMEQVKNQLSKTPRITGHFEQNKFMKGMNKPINSKGTLYFENDQMSMIYTQPVNDFMVINAKQFVLRSRGRKINNSLKAGSPTLVLRNTLVYCMKGDVQFVANENKAQVTYTLKDGNHVFDLTKEPEKGKKGYCEINLVYRASDAMLLQMKLVENNGNYTVYDMTNFDTTTAIDPAVFTVPKK